jgi:rhamnulokinase
VSIKRVIAVDLGAESGRVMPVAFDGSTLSLHEGHVFSNGPVKAGERLYWDILRLWCEAQRGIDALLPGSLSLGIDTWGNDFALLDRDGRLLANPVHYRDRRTDGMAEWVSERVPRRAIFERTGIQYLLLNALYQIASLVRDRSPLLDVAATFLTIPDLLNCWLTGQVACEFTNATTTQCYNPRRQDWDRETLAALGIPTHIFPIIVQPGTRLGEYRGVPVIAPACHDTGSAVIAVPATTADFAYISSGTWSLLGLEVREPIITDAAFAANITNEGGACGTFRLLKNVMGLWLTQECRRTWQEQGQTYSYDELVALANEAKPFRSLIDPDHPSFMYHGDIPARVRDFCAKSDQPSPETVGQVIRTVYESLALKYRFVVDDLIRLTGRRVEVVHVVGGGSRNALLCQMTADVLERPVLAGPVEATAFGNALVQFIALGEIADLAEARRLLGRSVTLTRYDPRPSAALQETYKHFRALVTTPV